MIDFRDTPSYKEDSYFRKEYVEKLLSWQNQHVIKVITGVRRSGKSVILKEVCKEISKSEYEEFRKISAYERFPQHRSQKRRF